MKRIMLITIAASALAATGVLAESQDASRAAENLKSEEVAEMRFTDMDTDVDGMVSVDEYDAAHGKFMQSEGAGNEHGEELATEDAPKLMSHDDMDLNGDGMVTEAEYLEAREKYEQSRGGDE